MCFDACWHLHFTKCDQQKRNVQMFVALISTKKMNSIRTSFGCNENANNTEIIIRFWRWKVSTEICFSFGCFVFLPIANKRQSITCIQLFFLCFIILFSRFLSYRKTKWIFSSWNCFACFLLLFVPSFTVYFLFIFIFHFPLKFHWFIFNF